MSRTMFVTALLTVTPALAQAECAWHQQQAAAAACTAGTVYDAKTDSCVKPTG